MKSFFKILCLVLALTSTAGIAVAKDTAATPINKAEFANKVVNLNKADANTLRYYLKGIGEVKAEAIIQYRKDNGKFSSAADLLKVSGIGEATFKGLKKNVSTSRGETSAPKLPTAGAVAKSKANSSKKSSKKSPPLLDKADEKKEAAKGKTAKKDDTSNSKTKAKKAKSEDDAAKKKAKSKKTSSKAAKCDPKKDKACKSKASKKKSTAKTKKRTSKPKTKKKTAKKE